jgi:hypothetical protein
MMAEAKEEELVVPMSPAADTSPLPAKVQTPQEEKKSSVMPGLEGGSEPGPRQSGSFLDGLVSFFRDFRAEAEVAGQDFQERTATKALSPEGVDYTERLQRFKEISRDQVKLQGAAVALCAALNRAAAAHDKVAARYKHEAKTFADSSSVAGGLQDGVASSDVTLESPKDGSEAELLSSASNRQEATAAVLRRLTRTVEEFSKSITLFNDKVLVDLDESVKTYRRARLLLDAAKPESDLLALKAAMDRSKEAVDVKLLLVKEKRFRDLQQISLLLQEALNAFVVESKHVFEP